MCHEIPLSIVTYYINQPKEVFLCTKEWDHQTLGGFPKVKEGSSRGFDGK